MEEVVINGQIYIKAHAFPDMKEGLEYCIVRTQSAGVFAGWFDRKNKTSEGTIFNARGIWYWDGACGLSQLAIDGTSKPENCKFSVKADSDLREIIQVLPCTEKSRKSIDEVAIWKK